MTMPAIVARLRAAGCVYAEDEARLLTEAAGDKAELDALVSRRAAGEPLEQVVGWASFCGLRIVVEPGVFVPRRRTEFLVAQAATLVRPGDVMLDLCCGAGAIAAAMAATVPGLDVHAADIDAAAVRCARRNVPGAVYQGDLFDPLPVALRGRVAVLAANVPYVPTAEVGTLPAEAREHEPLTALDGGPDGLAVLRRVAAQARTWLAPGGHLLTETSDRQASPAVQALKTAGLTAWLAADPDLLATVVIARHDA
jgi:release factor glutamine methyltransferase